MAFIGEGSARLLDDRIADAAVSHVVVTLVCGLYVPAWMGLLFAGAVDPLRYIFYGLPLLLAASVLFQRSPNVRGASVLMLFAFSLMVAVDLLLLRAHPDRAAVNAGIIMLLIAGLIPRLVVSERQIKLLFLATILIALLHFLASGHSSIRILDLIRTGTGSALSTAYNSHEGLLSSLYTLFFYATGQTTWAGLAALGMVMGGKRIGILALLLAITFYWIMSRQLPEQTRSGRFAVLLATLAAINITALNLPQLSGAIYNFMQLDVHIEEVMLGRHDMGVELVRELGSRSFGTWLFGAGPGFADALAMRIEGQELPHNDWLKILFDYGVLGSVVFTIFVAFVFSTTPLASALAVLSAIIMMTDNILVYPFYQIPAAMMLAYSENYPDRIRTFRRRVRGDDNTTHAT